MASRLDLFTLKQLVGHKKTSTTEKYYHNNEFMLKSAIKRDVLFNDLLDWTDQIGEIVAKIEDLCVKENQSYIDIVALSQAVVCLRQAIKNRDQ